MRLKEEKCKHLCKEHLKILMRGTKYDLNKWKYILWFLERLIINVSISLNLMYTFNVIVIKIASEIFLELNKLMVIHTEN